MLYRLRVKGNGWSKTYSVTIKNGLWAILVKTEIGEEYPIWDTFFYDNQREAERSFFALSVWEEYGLDPKKGKRSTRGPTYRSWYRYVGD